MLSFGEFLNENFELKVNDVVQIEGKKYLVTKILEDGFEAEHYVVEGDYIEETDTITVKGEAMYVHKNVGTFKIFAMKGEYTMETKKDMSKNKASDAIKKIFA